MATWPATLPSPRNSGYRVNPIDQTIRTDMDVGYSRTRRRTSARSDQVAAEWLFTDAQLDTFRTWFDGDGEGGAAWFDVDLYVGNTGASSVTARFVGAWTAVAASCSSHWVVSGTLEVRE